MQLTVEKEKSHTCTFLHEFREVPPIPPPHPPPASPAYRAAPFQYLV